MIQGKEKEETRLTGRENKAVIIVANMAILPKIAKDKVFLKVLKTKEEKEDVAQEAMTEGRKEEEDTRAAVRDGKKKEDIRAVVREAIEGGGIKERVKKKNRKKNSQRTREDTLILNLHDEKMMQ